MTTTARSPEAAALTDLIQTVFRMNNLTLLWGDRLVAPFGLTSARWQILGAIAAAERPQPVAWLARDLGANRQNVQRIVNDLQQAGLVAFEPNPHHRRAQLVVLTAKGRGAFDAAIRTYEPQAEALTAGLTVDEIREACRVVAVLKGKLEGELDAQEQP